jgi:hypothetical protein
VWAHGGFIMFHLHFVGGWLKPAQGVFSHQVGAKFDCRS